MKVALLTLFAITSTLFLSGCDWDEHHHHDYQGGAYDGYNGGYGHGDYRGYPDYNNGYRHY